MSKMKLAPAQPTEDDARLVMEWRNDPLTRQMSYHPDVKKWPDFYREFREEYFVLETLPPLFAEVGEERVAFVRFRPYEDPELEGELVDIGITVNPEKRGRGYATQAIRRATMVAHESGADIVVAEIKDVNEASLRAFVKADYEEYDRVYKELPGLVEPAPVVRYLARRATWELQ